MRQELGLAIYRMHPANFNLSGFLFLDQILQIYRKIEH